MVVTYSPSGNPVNLNIVVSQGVERSRLRLILLIFRPHRHILNLGLLEVTCRWFFFRLASE